MDSVIFYTILTLSGMGAFFAIILFLVAKQFHVDENPLIDDVEDVLPSANCGACGSPGCRPFAETCVKANDLEGLFCPVGGNETMKEVAKVLGLEAKQADPKLAVIRCNGSCENRPRTSHYDGIQSCASASLLYRGDTDCSYGCLGLGDCVRSCRFEAMYIDPKTKLPVIIEDKCTSCGACVKACPKNIIELRKRGPKNRRIFVSCINKDKGGIAKKACTVACIGCSLCLKECKFDAITIENNLAYIDFEKCRLCRKCPSVCPTKAIWELNFPPKPEIKQSNEINAG